MGFFSNAFLPVKSETTFKISDDWVPAGIFGGVGWRPSKTGLMVTDDSAQGCAAFFACQRAIAETIALLPRRFYKETEEDGGTGRMPVKNQSTRIIKREANPMMGSSLFFDLLQRNALRFGNGYAEIQFDGNTGDPIAVWPIPPGRVNPRCVEKSMSRIDIVYDITLLNGKQITMSKDRILHIPGVFFDGLKGYPILDFAVQAMGLSQALEDYSSLFFKNGGGLPGYVSVPDSFNLEQIANQKKHYEITNEGLDNAHRWKFLYESSKFTPAGATPAESEMIDSRTFQIQEIARYHRMPLHKIQETSKATGYSSLEQFNNEYVSDCLMPWINRWEEEINRKFFEEDEDLFIKFNTNALLRGDAKSRALFYRTMVFTSIMTPNEARALEDLPPIEGGNKRLVPLNMSVGGESPEDDKASEDANERIED